MKPINSVNNPVVASFLERHKLSEADARSDHEGMCIPIYQHSRIQAFQYFQHSTMEIFFEIWRKRCMDI